MKDRSHPIQGASAAISQAAMASVIAFGRVSRTRLRE
jgi:hypothetical protein